MIRILTMLVTAAISVALQGGGITATPLEKSLVGGTVIIGTGAVSKANDGLFERVAINRMMGYAVPTLPEDTMVDDYDSLIATESCEYIGWNGKLVVTNGDDVVERTVLVVDCQNEIHRLNGGSLTDLGLLADVSNSDDILHWRGYLVLRE